MNPREMKIRAAEEVAREYPSLSDAESMIRTMSAFNIKLAVDLRSTTIEQRLRYEAMYMRLKKFALEHARPDLPARVVFLQIDEDSI